MQIGEIIGRWVWKKLKHNFIGLLISFSKFVISHQPDKNSFGIATTILRGVMYLHIETSSFQPWLKVRFRRVFWFKNPQRVFTRIFRLKLAINQHKRMWWLKGTIFYRTCQTQKYLPQIWLLQRKKLGTLRAGGQSDI